MSEKEKQSLRGIVKKIEDIKDDGKREHAVSVIEGMAIMAGFEKAKAEQQAAASE